jgi:PIF1-like helicase
MHRPVASFEDAKTVDGIMYQTFQSAALQMGLFNSSNEGFYTLEEAVSCYTTPAQLRFLFSRIIVEGYPALPMWNHFLPNLTADFLSSMHSQEHATDRALEILADFLSDSSHSLSSFGLPEPWHRSSEIIQEEEAFTGRLVDLQEHANDMILRMTSKQSNIFNEILADIQLSRSTRHPIQPHFIEGKPGCRKTFMVDVVCSLLWSEGFIVLVCGSSALSVTLYEQGRTAHKLFGIPVNEVRPSLRNDIIKLTHDNMITQ